MTTPGTTTPEQKSSKNYMEATDYFSLALQLLDNKSKMTFSALLRFKETNSNSEINYYLKHSEIILVIENIEQLKKLLAVSPRFFRGEFGACVNSESIRIKSARNIHSHPEKFNQNSQEALFAKLFPTFEVLNQFIKEYPNFLQDIINLKAIQKLITKKEQLLILIEP